MLNLSAQLVYLKLTYLTSTGLLKIINLTINYYKLIKLKI